MRGRPDGLDQVADVEATGLEGSLLEDRERRTCRPRTRRPRPREGVARTRHAAAIARSSERPPARAEDRLARPLLVRPAGRRRRSAPRASWSPARRRIACRERGGVARRDEQRVLAVGEQLARGGRVGRDERRPAGERLEGLVRDHARGLVARAEDAERTAGRLDLARAGRRTRPTAPTRRSPAASRGATRAGRCRRRGTGSRAPARPPRGSSRARAAGSACRRRARETGARGCQPGLEEPLLGADEADLDPSSRRPNSSRKKRGVRLGVGDDDVGAPERPAVDEVHDARAAVEPGRNRPRSSTSVS